ncbi:MAG: Maf-like protein [Chromatiales bacterium]|nr:Maf-like protein [Chromatiales bacterium]
MTQLILASTSPFRREILQKLHLDFESCAPEIDEQRLEGESPEALVARLARAKAEAVTEKYPNALIIGSDQVAINGEEILGKPGTHEKAIEQLTACSGKKVTFLTGLALHSSTSGETQVKVVPFHVHFRELTTQQIENYLNVEKPYNCAGSFKSEGFGITLFSKLEGDDPNTLIGLPLIELIKMLEQEGLSPI